jgi:cytochrome c oxidase subunit 2
MMMLDFLLASTEQSFWMPEGVSNQVGHVDELFYFIYWMSLVFFVGIVGVMFWFMWIYRRRTDGQQADPRAPIHSTLIEIVWTGIPLLLAVYLFYLGFGGFVYLAVPPPESYTINVHAKKWTWSFSYDTGYNEAGVLHLWAHDGTEQDKAIRLLIAADDVLHSLYIPKFRVKMDAVPGRYSDLWFTVPRAGLPADLATWQQLELTNPNGEKKTFPVMQYHLTCTEYCGTDHSNMTAVVYVHPDRKAYDAALAFMATPPGPGADPIVVANYGEKLYKQNCAVCHNIDGPVKTGPNWRETAALLKARGTRKTSAGDQTVDENYIRDSIIEPQKAVVEGYPASMSPFKGVMKTPQINAILAYMRKLAE